MPFFLYIVVLHQCPDLAWSITGCVNWQKAEQVFPFVVRLLDCVSYRKSILNGKYGPIAMTTPTPTPLSTHS